MIMKYITKVKANMVIHSNKKSGNLLDGTYNSIYKGKSSNFEDLREYVIGDNIKDIDWKASARSSTTLVRQFRAEKKHNIMIVFDSGKKMNGDTNLGDCKREVALMTAGTISYVASTNGDYIGSCYDKDSKMQFFPFKLGFFNIEKILSYYEKDSTKIQKSNLEKILNYINKNIKRRMIVFVITDLEGMDKIKENTIKMLTVSNDVLFININDAYMTGENVYDLENNMQIPQMFLNDKKLHDLEIKVRQDVYQNCLNKFKKYNVQVENIDGMSEIVPKIISLLERHRNANIS